MPFRETCLMEERIRMLSDYDTGNWSVTELCRRYGCAGTPFTNGDVGGRVGTGGGSRMARMLRCIARM